MVNGTPGENLGNVQPAVMEDLGRGSVPVQILFPVEMEDPV